MSDNIRVGLIGYGYASKTFHAPLIAGTPGMMLAAVSSSDATKVHADWPSVPVVSEPKHLFNDPNIDLIVIPTPNDTHFPLAKAALEAGKHVIVDKPFTVTLSQARELDALAKGLGRLLSVFHNRRWDSDFLTVKTLLSEGTLGEILFFESHFDRFRPQVRNRWREQAGPGSGIWYDLAPSSFGPGCQPVWSAGEHDGRSGPAQTRGADDRLLPRGVKLSAAPHRAAWNDGRGRGICPLYHSRHAGKLCEVWPRSTGRPS